MSSYAIETENITKTFPNGVTAVKSLNLKIPEGTVFGFLGPNGAGKTTTVRILNGSLTPTSGTYKVFNSSGDDSLLRTVTATLGDHTGMYASLTVRNNLRFFAALYGMEKDRAEKRIEEVIDKLHLNDKIDSPLGTLSTGLAKRAQLARVMLHHPRLLFLDEPTSGLDPDAADEVNRMIRLLADEEKTTVFLCTHNLFLAQSICDIFGFISKGVLTAYGTPDKLIEEATDKKILRVTAVSGSRDFEYTDEKEIQAILKKLLDSGEAVIEAVRVRPSLLDVYRKNVEEGMIL